jgi:hypothetical protein
LVALADYLICPYDLEKAKTWAADWVIYRCAVNIFITLTYFGFWSLTLYSLGYGKRKFNQDYVATPSRMFHNIWYCVLGAIQLGLWEALFMNCYATGKLDYIKNEEVGPPLLPRVLCPAVLVHFPEPSRVGCAAGLCHAGKCIPHGVLHAGDPAVSLGALLLRASVHPHPRALCVSKSLEAAPTADTARL